MAYVYLLNTYDEHGPENMVGTLDRAGVEALLVKHWKVEPAEKEALALYLRQPDEGMADRGPINLSDGWGGIQYSVVELR